MTRRDYNQAFEATNLAAEVITKLDNYRNFSLSNSSVLGEININLIELIPFVVVVGDQSSGKSSLLSALIGFKLPTGVGTCSKCPIEVRFRRGSEEKAKLRIEGSKLFEKSYDLFDEAEIFKINETLADSKTLFNKDAIIIIETEAPTHPNLTYVDLPGFRLDHQVPEMIAERYIHRPNCLIIHVLSLGDSDLSNKLSRKIIARADPEHRRTLTVYTKLDISSRENPQRLKEIIEETDPRGILTCSMDSKGQIISEEVEVKTIESLALNFAFGRNLILDKITSFTEKLIFGKVGDFRKALHNSRNHYNELLNKIGAEKQSPETMAYSWRNSIRISLETVLGGSNEFVKAKKALDSELAVIFPSQIPIELDPSKISAKIEESRGLGLSFTIGCEPLIKEISEEAVNAIKENVFKWIASFKTLLVKLVGYSLLGQKNFSSAGEIIADEMVRIISGEIQDLEKFIEDSLIQIYTQLTLLDQSRYAELVYRERTKPLENIYHLLGNPNSTLEIQRYISTFIDPNTRKHSILRMEAEETKVKIQFYWEERINNIKQILFEKSNLVQNSIIKQLKLKVETFSRLEFFKETEEIEMQRLILSQALRHFDEMLILFNKIN